MTEFVSRWLSFKPSETPIDRPDKTERISSVSSVKASSSDLKRFLPPSEGEQSPCTPLDAAIIASEASRRSLDEIETRLARLKVNALDPAATLLDHQLVRDWTAIRDAKRAGKQAASASRRA